jgi:hypothetical protein
MAFLNFLKTGTYSIIENVQYSKQREAVAFELKVFRDNTKADALMTLGYALQKPDFLREAEFVSSPPESPQANQQVCVENGLDDFSGLDGTIQTFNGTEWKNLGVPNETIWDTSAEIAKKWNGTSWSPISSVFRAEDFAQFFAMPVLETPGNNLIKQCYEFLKTKWEFQGTVEDG